MELIARFDLIPVERHALVKATLAALPLVHDERIVRQRRGWYASYLSGEVTLAGLRTFAPLIADAVERWRAGHPDEPLP